MIIFYLSSSSTVGLLEKLVMHCFVIFLFLFRKSDLIGVGILNKQTPPHTPPKNPTEFRKCQNYFTDLAFRFFSSNDPRLSPQFLGTLWLDGGYIKG